MKILFVSNMYPDPVRPVYGTFVRYQAHELRRRGHDLTVISPQPVVPPLPGIPKRLRELDGRVPEECDDNGVRVLYPRTVSLPAPWTKPITAVVSRLRARGWIDRLERADVVPDVVNAHVAQPNGYAAIPIAEHFGSPLVTTVHGADLNLLYDQRVNRPFLERTFDRSDAIIVNSELLKDLAVSKYGDSRRIHVVPNGIPIDVVEAAREEPPPREIDEEIPTIVSVGDLIETKGHGSVLEALSDVPAEVQYLVVGDGPTRRDLEAEAAARALENVRFLGEVPNEEVFRYLWHANMFVLPSTREAFGIAYLEAMSCGLPVVACEGQGPEEFVEDGDNGFLVPARDASAIALVIRRLLEDPGLAEAIGAAARETAREYTWERNAERVESIYEAVTDGRG